MELQLNPGRGRERPVHGFGCEACYVVAGRSDAGQKSGDHVVQIRSAIVDLL